MEVTPLLEKHITQCVDLHISAFNPEPWGDEWTVETATKYLYEFFTHKRFVGFVVIDNNVVTGALLAREKTYFCGDEFYIEELFVAPDSQRKGYGKALMKAVEKYVEGKGFDAITLLTDKNTHAMDFYSKNKYKPADNMRLLYKLIR